MLGAAIFSFNLAAQSESAQTEETAVSSEMTSDIPFDQNSVFSLFRGFAPIGLDAGSIKEQTYPLGRGLFKKHHIEQALELCPNISKSKTSQSDLLPGQNVDEINDTGIGMNFGYSVIFNPGYEKDGQLHLNKAGFAYNVGFIASFSSSDRYGTICDLMAKVGFETCHNRKMGFGADFLIGYGKSAGDVFFYNNILENTEPSSVSPYTLWGKKIGGQIWIKTGLLGNALNSTDILIFARLIKAPDPGEFGKASLNTYNVWREEYWSFGVIIRYRM